MATLLLLACALLGLALCGLPQAHAAQFAVLVCGSKGWWNYRHHADVCHAYHTLRARGVPAENIITMLYDDNIVNNRRNPFKGQLFNRPSGAADGDPEPVDVYAGCEKDYRTEDVTPQNLYAVLTGDADAVRGVGTGRVLQSTSEDDVFINFVDHGAPGMVVMPGGDVYAEDLMEALQQMNAKRMFKRLVFYMEACESGSMFRKVPDELRGKMFAVTAANARESSFATYCPPLGDKVDGKHMGTCLGDDFSVRWLEDTDAESLQRVESLADQYARVRDATKRSHVLDFGAVEEMGAEPIDDFLGSSSGDGLASALRGDLAAATRTAAAARLAAQPALPPGAAESQVDSRDVPLVSMLHALAAAPADAALEAELEQELAHRRRTRALFHGVAARALAADGAPAAVAAARAEADALLAGARGRPHPEQRACHRAANEAFKRACTADGAWSDYALRFSAALQELCERQSVGGVEKVLAAIDAECGAAPAAEY